MHTQRKPVCDEKRLREKMESAAIDHVIQLIGIDHVAIGGDWFDEPGWNWVLDITGMQDLTRGLVISGYNDEDIRKIFGG